MDRELMKSMREDHMDMMMMMQIDKIPQTSHPFTGVGESPTIDFSCGTAPPVFDTLPLANQPSPLPFIAPLGEEPITPSIFSNGMVGRSRNTGELSGAIGSFEPGQKRSSVTAMREMIFRIAAMQPIHIDPESVKPPKRRNVKISKDPQSVAARHRRERISERIRILQRLVPGGTKMDTASMLDEAIHYVKFLKTQVQSLERAAANGNMALGFPSGISNVNFSTIAKAYHNSQIFSSAQLHS